MSDRLGPQVYSIAAHRGFADALVAGLLPRYSEDGLGLALALAGSTILAIAAGALAFSWTARLTGSIDPAALKSDD